MPYLRDSRNDILVAEEISGTGKNYASPKNPTSQGIVVYQTAPAGIILGRYGAVCS
jgi:hypothetical protein